MANPYHHAISSARKWGGKPDDYLPIHRWFDESKEHLADFRHRALRHHTQGIFECERKFGPTISIEGGKKIPTRWVGEQHVQEDCGCIPTVADWLMRIAPEPWMNRARKLSLELEGGIAVSPGNVILQREGGSNGRDKDHDRANSRTSG